MTRCEDNDDCKTIIGSDGISYTYSLGYNWKLGQR